MSNLTKWTFLALCAFLAPCATGAETTAALGAGVAGLGALFHELAAGAKSGAVSPTEFATGLGGVAGATAVALNSWRNLTRKKALAKGVA